MKTILFLSIAILCKFDLSAQTQTEECSENFRAQEGTFEIISHSKRAEVFTTSILCQIESRRDEKKIIDWEVSPLTTIRILPKGVTISQEHKN